nr:YwdI family protein [Mammaliicoccus sp. Marseille-Q6498]
MISRDQLIAAIEQELVSADNASSNEVFNRHMHAIHTLSGLVDNENGNSQDMQVKQDFRTTSTAPQKKEKPQISNEELRKMGGKVSAPSTSKQNDELLATDDGFGNGDSIFDF